MKKILLLIAVLFGCGIIQAQTGSQADGYIPLIKEGKKWLYRTNSMYSWPFSKPNYFIQEFCGTEVINGKTYNKCYYHEVGETDFQSREPNVYMREEGKKVYIASYGVCLDELEANGEILLFDFNDMASLVDSHKEHSRCFMNEHSITATDTITDCLGTKRIQYSTDQYGKIIEGIGYIGSNQFFNIFDWESPTNGTTCSLVNVTDADGQVEFLWASGALDLVREGVKWVNEVTNTGFGTEEGDLTFYCINEMKGDTTVNGSRYLKCYQTASIDNNVANRNSHLRFDSNKPAALLRNDLCTVDCIRLNAGDEQMRSDDWVEEFALRDEVTLYDSGYEQPGVYASKYDLSLVDFTVIEGFKCDIYGNEKHKFVESVGIDDPENGYLLYPYPLEQTSNAKTRVRLNHVENAQGEIIYKGSAFKPIPNSAVTDVKVTKTVDDNYYNLMGQPVAHPEDAPGIYIHEGKKVVVK